MGVVKQLQCLAAGCIFGILSAILWYQCYQSWGYNTWLLSFTVISAVLLLPLAVMALDMAFLHPADSHSLRTLFMQYLFYRFLRIYGFYSRLHFKTLSKDVAKSQEEILVKSVIQPNADTQFGRKHNFADIKCRDDYRKNVPLSTYDDYIPYIEQIENNEKDLQGVLFKEPVVFLAVTSGSTGRNKVIPIGEGLKKKGLMMYALNFDLVNRNCNIGLLRELRLGYRPTVGKSASGLEKAPISYHMNKKKLPFNLLPPEVYDISDEQTALYVEALLALAEREVGFFQGFMSTLVYAFWKVIEQNWKQMCNDIEQGFIGKDLKLKPYIREAVEKQLLPDPLRAADLRFHFKQGSLGLFKKIWPRLGCLQMFSTGGFTHYAKILMANQFDGVFLASTHHGASEGLFGLQLSADLDNPLDIKYSACLPLLQEYLPVAEESLQNSGSQDSPAQTLYPEQLQLGQCYEVVCTSPMGMYRYRMGDVIKVVDFYNQCPVYEFQYRTGHVLNVYWEKTPENVVYDALQMSFRALSLTLIDYTTTEDISLLNLPEYKANSDSKHYVLFLEASRDNGSPANLSEEEKLLIDENLCSRMELYGSLRKKGSIGPMHVIEVNPGTFAALRTRMLGTHNNQQLKMPRVVRNAELLNDLLLASHKEKAG